MPIKIFAFDVADDYDAEVRAFRAEAGAGWRRQRESRMRLADAIRQHNEACARNEKRRRHRMSSTASVALWLLPLLVVMASD